RKYGYLSLAVIRVLIGFEFLWGFFDKLLGLGLETPAGQGMIDGGSPSSFVVFVAKGYLKEFWSSLAGNEFVDVVLMLGLLALGVSMMLGIASRLSAIGGFAIMIVFYSMMLPPSDNPFVEAHLIQAFAILAVYFMGGYDRWSLGPVWKGLSIVKRFPSVLA
ncbi:MAG: hypothetical protein MJZ68_01020, partial [archaeon]|nr:hypothetical protein [archaeon]